eukprot:TRINITY_DN84737_c0_g1_i1.p1 TRINITY_DN84737_c0_g1~~TRINITY_DN84737_c0_g1_i1.p1  ORF type:complete len:359 (-),score=180.51 TRINITY_DN84737_c0_g1_i1:22-1098(-)
MSENEAKTASDAASSDAKPVERREMEYRFLGHSGLKVSVLSFGNWVTQGKESQSLDVARECITKAIEMGVNFFDTAEAYARGGAEKVLGAVLKKGPWKRSSLVVSTKIFWGDDTPNGKGLSRKHIVEGMRASLKRLQMDYVDLVYCHRPDPTTPIEETVRAMNWVIDQGWAFYWGTSEWSAAQILEARAVAERLHLIPPLMEQPQYNMLRRERVESEFRPLLSSPRRLGLTIWSPLAMGLLTGKYNDGIPEEGTRFSGQASYSWKKLLQGPERDAVVEQLKSLGAIAEELGCTQAQLSLAWCIKNEDITSVITGASRVEQVEENMRAIDFVPLLTDDVMARIEAILKNKPAEPVTHRS